MKTSIAGIGLLLGSALLTPACAKHDDAADVTTTNETEVAEASGGFNETAPDPDAAAETPIANDPLADAGVGSAAATPH